MEDVCVLCGKRISDWMAATGKTMWIARKIVHRACAQDATIEELEKKVQGDKNCHH